MASRVVGSNLIHQFKPIISSNQAEARRNVLKAYKLWAKKIKFMIHDYELERRPYEIRLAFKRLWTKNAHLTDPRAIDRLVQEANLEYEEVINYVMPKHSAMNRLFSTEHLAPKPTDFLSKFFLGHMVEDMVNIRKWAIVGSLGGTVGCIWAKMMYIEMEKKITTSNEYKFAVDLLDEHDFAQEALGPPVRIGRPEPFNSKLNIINKADCRITIPVNGETDSGTLIVHYKQDVVDDTKLPVVTKSAIRNVEILLEKAQKRFTMYEDRSES